MNIIHGRTVVIELIQYVQYPLVAGIIFFGIVAYMKVAIRKRMLDIPNERSSHKRTTILGGGIVFPLAGVVYCLFHLDLTRQVPFLAGFLLVSIVSFLDDIKPIPIPWRLLTQVVALTLVFYGLALFTILPAIVILGTYILFTGTLNSFNFMDGINGMTGLYSLVVLGSMQWVNLTQVHFTDPDLMWYGMIACGIFLIYNFRKRALCFAGDIGSVSIGFWVITLIIKLMLVSGSFVWILLLSVYGIETVGTLVHRLSQKKSIFKAHRTFFFQILSNECHWPQCMVSSLYALTQSVMSIIVIKSWKTYPWWGLGTIILSSLTALYLLKFMIQKRLHQEPAKSSSEIS